ncbi:MAG: hypothetical protein N2035_07265, partial [Chthoniobacterales bacterium]|nr:hypothetical protein [Chthoniobacterales bacterium]
LRKARSTGNPNYVVTLEGWELKLGDTCPQGYQLRPHIVWFGEAVELMPEAIRRVEEADLLVVVGTSLQVYPAAGLVDFASSGAVKVLIDPRPARISGFKVYACGASEGLRRMSLDFGLPC